MSTERWFTDLLDSLKDDFDFRLETIILNLTEQIAKKMEEEGISRKKLADLLNVTPPAVTKVLNGTSNFTLKTLLSLADALELDFHVEFRAKDAKPAYYLAIGEHIRRSEEAADFTFGDVAFWEAGSFTVVDVAAYPRTVVSSGTSEGFNISVSGVTTVTGIGEKTDMMASGAEYWPICSQKEEDQQAV
jgi:transcriptional regulator with XRE-family HTH domain